jgi:hypothetical protein
VRDRRSGSGRRREKKRKGRVLELGENLRECASESTQHSPSAVDYFKLTVLIFQIPLPLPEPFPRAINDPRIGKILEQNER